MTMLNVIMGNGGFYSCLSEHRGVSAWWKETAQTHVFVLSRSLLLNHLEPQPSKNKLLLPIMRSALSHTLLCYNLCQNSCIYSVWVECMMSSIISFFTPFFSNLNISINWLIQVGLFT